MALSLSVVKHYTRYLNFLILILIDRFSSMASFACDNPFWGFCYVSCECRRSQMSCDTM